MGALVLNDPPTDWLDDAHEGAHESDQEILGGKQYESGEMLRTWQFWLMYGMFVAVSGTGLMLTAKIVSFAAAVGLQDNIGTLSGAALFND